MINLNTDPGEGNLNLRAYIAAVVGPLRVPHGQRTTKQLQLLQAVQVAKNSSPGKEAFFVSAWLPAIATLPAGVGLVIGFTSSESAGASADRVTLLPVIPDQRANRYNAVILPSEQLYAWVISRSDGVAIPAGTTVPLIVSQVAF